MDESVLHVIENEIISGSWEAIRRRLSSNSAKRIFRADYVNDNGLNLFNILCAQNDPPADIVEKMIDTNKAYEMGSSSLFFAAETGSANTIKIILDRMRKVTKRDGSDENKMWADYKGYTPLERLWMSRLNPEYQMWNGEVNDDRSVIELIKRMDKVTRYDDMTAEMKDLWDKTTYFLQAALASMAQTRVLSIGEQRFLIHEIVEHGGKEEIILPTELLWFATKLYPDLLRARDENYDLPLHVALKTSSRTYWSIFDCLDGLESWDEFQNDEQIQSILGESRRRTIVSVLLRGFPESASLEDGSGRLPLQIFCECLWAGKEAQITSQDFDALLKAAPKAPFAINKDGNAPLHILCKLLFRNRRDRIFIICSILDILELAPQAAGLRDQCGRFPLNLLLHGSGPRNERSWRQDREAWGMVVELVDSAPHALDIPDVLTRLYPFMMAAEGENSSLDSVYTLLRRNPMNVRGGIIRTDYELYLERKVNELSLRVKTLEDSQP